VSKPILAKIVVLFFVASIDSLVIFLLAKLAALRRTSVCEGSSRVRTSWCG
jgi:hypothetical protein